MSDHTVLHHRHRHAPSDRDVRAAWWCVALALPAVVVGFAAGEGVASALGYHGTGLPPWWVGAMALAVGVLPVAVLTVIAWRRHRRALARGEDRTTVPSYLLLLLTTGLVVVNAFSWMMRILFE